MHPHLEQHGERAKDTAATLLAAATASGGFDSVRDTFHMFAGIWGDCAAILVSGLTVLWWGIRLFDTLASRWNERKLRRLLGGPAGSTPRPWPRPGRSQD